MTDPGQEALAEQRLIRSGLKTLSESLRERGYDPQATLDEWAADAKLLDKLGLTLDSDPRRTTQAGNPTPSVQAESAPEPAAPAVPVEPGDDEEDEE